MDASNSGLLMFWDGRLVDASAASKLATTKENGGQSGKCPTLIPIASSYRLSAREIIIGENNLLDFEPTL